MAARGFLGAGDVYIERSIAGVSQGMKGPYYADKFEIKPNVDKKDLISKGRNDYGQVLESVSVQQPADFTLDLSEVNKEAFILAMLGAEASLTQSSGTLTDAPITAKLDSWVSVGKEGLTGTITVEHTSGTPAYVEGTDFIVNKQLGLIKALTGGAITDNQSVNVSGAYGAIAGARIRGAVNSDLRAKIVFDGKNQADGLPVIVTCWEAIIAADSAFDFLADDFNVISLPGTLKTPTGKTEPFIIDLRNAA